MVAQLVGRLDKVFELDAPVPDFTALLNRKLQAKRREIKLGERSLMLTPLVLLAACGGGGGGGVEPIPAPPGGGGGSPSPSPSPTPTPSPGPATIDLGAMGGAGTAISAPLTGGQFGFSIATLQPGVSGDVTGDGFADLVVGAPLAGGTGQVFIIDGKNLNGAAVRTLTGAAANDRFGFDVGVGNIGGDGRADVLVGAPGVTAGNANAGRTYAFFSSGNVNSAGSIPSGENGFTLTIFTGGAEGNVAFPNANGDLGPNVGAAVAVLGDVNGDGRNDFFVALPGLDTSAFEDVGEAYAGFGQASYLNGSEGIGTLSNPGRGFKILSQQTAEGEGYTAAASGEINGSGGADLVVANAKLGSVAIRFNNVTPPSVETNNSDLNGSNGVNFTLSTPNARFGESVAVGDINGDGRADVIVGAPGVNKVYILMGAASYGSATIDAASPGSASVIEISGAGGFGTSVAYVGDFNNAGGGDFVVGAPSDGANGSAYILLGSTSASASTFNLSSSPNVIKLVGTTPGTGAEVAGPGDLNGDGRADVAVAAFNSVSNVNGAVYIVFGDSNRTGASVGQEAVAFDDGSGSLFGGHHSDSSFAIDPAMAASDLPPSDVFI
jgi:hypothetical protein